MDSDIKYYITDHAKDQMKLRGISCEEVVNCLKKPGQTVSAEKGRTVYQKIMPLNGKTHLLRIVVEEERNILNVITVYKTSKVDKYWIQGEVCKSDTIKKPIF